MVFSSPVFLFLFLPTTLFLYLGSFLLTKKKNLFISNLVLLILSLGFYTFSEGKYLLVLLFSSLINFFLALKIENEKNKPSSLNSFFKEKLYLTLAILTSLSILGYFKYTNFFYENLFLKGNTPLFKIVLPLGISFYTFQAMSYTIDVFNREVKATKNIVNFLCYVTMFPQLVAGPIVRYKQIEDELKKREIKASDFSLGIKRFIIGLSKKVLIADTLALPVDLIFSLPNSSISQELVLTASLFYALQIYFDFSGYSDMAIGIGKMLGFSFPENFNNPYTATSITDFWRRWHISLSTWFRDYLYIPLGGNRVKKIRNYFNLIIVFSLCGLWHGASWSFVIWGLFHGMFLILEKFFFNSKKIKIPKILKYKFFKHLYVFTVILISWIIFRADSFYQATYFIKTLFCFTSNELYPLRIFLNKKVILTFILGLCCIGFLNPLNENFKKHFKTTSTLIKTFIYPILLFLCFLEISINSYSPFIYFRF